MLPQPFLCVLARDLVVVAQEGRHVRGAVATAVIAALVAATVVAATAATTAAAATATATATIAATASRRVPASKSHACTAVHRSVSRTCSVVSCAKSMALIATILTTDAPVLAVRRAPGQPERDHEASRS